MPGWNCAGTQCSMQVDSWLRLLAVQPRGEGTARRGWWERAAYTPGVHSRVHSKGVEYVSSLGIIHARPPCPVTLCVRQLAATPRYPAVHNLGLFGRCI